MPQAKIVPSTVQFPRRIAAMHAWRTTEANPALLGLLFELSFYTANVLLTRLLEWTLFCAIQAQNEGRGNRSGAAIG